jgi:hypothetical protein
MNDRFFVVLFLIAVIVTSVFGGLEDSGFINWRWWWVMSPIWILMGVEAFLIIAIGLMNMRED